jgi:hypothetical protein
LSRRFVHERGLYPSEDFAEADDLPNMELVCYLLTVSSIIMTIQ